MTELYDDLSTAFLHHIRLFGIQASEKFEKLIFEKNKHAVENLWLEYGLKNTMSEEHLVTAGLSPINFPSNSAVFP